MLCVELLLLSTLGGRIFVHAHRCMSFDLENPPQFIYPFCDGHDGEF